MLWITAEATLLLFMNQTSLLDGICLNFSKGIRIFTSLGPFVGFLCLLLALGGRLQAQSDIPAKIDSLEKAALKQPADSLSLNAILRLGDYYLYQDIGKATYYFNQGRNISDSLGLVKAKARALNGMADIHENLNNYAKAIEYILQSLAFRKAAKDTVGLQRGYASLALLYGERNMYDEAFAAMDESDRYVSYDFSLSQWFANRHNKSHILSESGQKEESRKILLENLEIARDSGLSDMYLAVTTNNLGNMLREEKRYEEALPYLNEALALKEKTGDKFRLPSTLNNLADVMINLGNYTKAREHFTLAREYAEVSGNTTEWVETFFFEGELYKNMGNFEKAYTTNELYHQKKDSITKVTNTESADNLLLTFTVEQNLQKMELLQAENELVKAQNERNNGYLVAALTVGIFLVTMVIGLVIVYINNRKKNARLNRFNQELNNANSELAEANREKDALVQVVAHDLKAPITKTLALLEMIEVQGELSKDQQQVLLMLHNVNVSAKHLVADLLQIYHIETGGDDGPSAEFDARSMFEVMVQGYRPTAEKKNIGIESTTPDYPVMLNSRQDHLERVLDNLISNAIKFTPSGRRIYLDLANGGNGVVFSIRDEGPGISEEDQKKMFRKFQRLSAKPTGGESSTGLGLSIVKSLVERLDGQIDVESQLGEGTTFRVKLS